MVERDQGGSDSSGVPTIAELLMAYRDRTGASYADMSRKVRDEIHISQLQRLATQPPKEFPKHGRTIELLAELLQVPVTTIVLGYAAGLGIPVRQEGTLLERTLPPGTDILGDEERAAVQQVTRALVRLRNELMHGSSTNVTPLRDVGDVEELRPPRPDLSDARVAARRGTSKGRRVREQQDRDAET